MKRTLTLVSCASLLALAACGGGGSNPSGQPVTKRVQDTSKQAGAPTGNTDTMKMQEGQAPAKP